MAAKFRLLPELLIFVIYIFSLASTDVQLPGESTDPSIGLRISASLTNISLYRANLFQELCSGRLAIFTRIVSSVQSKPGVDNLSLLMLCGDILRNPRPEWKYPCGVGQKPVKSNQKGLQCDSCDLWYHTNCCRVNDIVYNALAKSPFSWICCGCGLPNFASSLFDTFDISMQNYYHSLPSSPTSSAMSPTCDNGTDLSQMMSSVLQDTRQAHLILPQRRRT